MRVLKRCFGGADQVGLKQREIRSADACVREAFPQAPGTRGRRRRRSVLESALGAAWLCTLVVLPAKLMAAPGLELTNAVVVFPSSLSGPERKAVTMLVEEVEKRARVHWPELSTWPAKADSAVAVIAVGPKSQLDAFGGPYARGLQDRQTAPGG